MGFEEFLSTPNDSILLIEWGERANLNSEDFININIEKVDENKRIIKVIR